MIDNKSELPRWKTIKNNDKVEKNNDIELTDNEIIMLYRNSCEDMGTGIAPVCNLEEWIKKQLTITNTITVTNNSGKMYGFI